MFKYLITDPKYYQNFKQTLSSSIQKYNPDMICFRDKTSTKNAKLAIEIAKYYKIPIVINQYFELLKLGFDGIHFTSTQLDLVDKYSQFITVASTHNEIEIKKAKTDFITYSPIFDSKGRKGIGIQKLNEISKLTDSKILALGGIISDKEVNEISTTKAYGFGSIRYFLL